MGPLFIRWPGIEPKDIDALTTNVDIHATLTDLFGIESEHATHGASMVPLVTGAHDTIRDWALAGVFGRWVHVLDGQRKYARGPAHAENLPLSMWSNRWSTMPVPSRPGLRLPNPDHRAVLDTMPESDIPVIKQPFEQGDLLPFWSVQPAVGEHYLYDIRADPGELENQLGSPEEARMLELLRVALLDVQAPPEQFQRLGLAP